MLSLCLALACVTTAAPAPTLAGQTLTLTGLDPALAEGLTEHLAQSFKRVHVLTQKDMITMLSIDRQKQLLGCSEAESSCMAELSNALGAQGVLTGELVSTGKHVQVNLRVIDPLNGRQLAAYSDELAGVDEAFHSLARGAEELEAQLLGAGARRSIGKRGLFTIVPGALGVASGVTGGVLLGLASSLYGRLTVQGAPGSFTEDPNAAATRGQAFQTTGWILVCAGAALLVTALAVWLLAGSGG